MKQTFKPNIKGNVKVSVVKKDENKVDRKETKGTKKGK